MTGTKQAGSKGTVRIGSIPFVLTGIALATTVSTLAASAAGTKPLPIERIGLDNARQLVVQFASEPGAFPTIPNVLDLPGPNHRVVVDFADTTINRAKIPTVEEMTAAMGKILPAINSIRYSQLPNAAKPTARIVLELSEDLKVTPRVVRVEETSVTINLGDEVKNMVVPTKPAGKQSRQVQSSAKPAAPAGDTVASAMTQASDEGGAPVPSLRGVPAVESAPVAAAPVAAAPATAVPAAYTPAKTVTTTQFAAAPAVLAGQPVVSADGETVALKGEQKIDEIAVPANATKSSTSSSGWDWNSAVENELASKVAETKTMGDGGAAAVAPQPSPKDDPEEAFVKKIAAKELGQQPVAAASAPDAPAVSTQEITSATERIAPAVDAVPVAVRETAPVAVQETAPVAVQETAPVAAQETAPVAVRKAPPVVVQESAPVAVRETTSNAMEDTAPITQQTAPAAVREIAPVAPRTTPVAAVRDEAMPEEPVKKSSPAPVDAAASDEAPVRSATTPEEAAAASAAPPAATPTPAEQPQEAADAARSLKLYNSAVRNHLSGKLMEAINDYKHALEANPSLAEAHSNLGLIYNQQHNYAGAIGEFHKALAINPKDAITYNGIGAALRAEKDWPGAIKNWQTAVDLDPKLATAHYNLGTAYENQKDYDRALEAYKDAITNDYRLGEAYYRMGLILQQKRQFDDAIAQYNQALKINAAAEYSTDAKQRVAELKAQKK